MVEQSDGRSQKKASGFKGYASKRFLAAVAIIIFVVWGFSSIPEPSNQKKITGKDELSTAAHTNRTVKGGILPALTQTTEPHSRRDSTTTMAPIAVNLHFAKADNDVIHESPKASAESPSTDSGHSLDSNASGQALTEDLQEKANQHAPEHETNTDSGHSLDDNASGQAPTEDLQEKANQHAPEHETNNDAKTAPHRTIAPSHEDSPTGVAFVEAVIKPMDFELNHRFWGWRPNDIINLTDNVNNFQLGVLEVTRRTVVRLSQRISRTGTADAFNTHLENSMNWLMIKSSRYWFPSPESKYKESIKELQAYKEDLSKGRGRFYTRADNLIPLLSSYVDLLGSCDESLVKQKNGDGSNVSTFKADDYFYYAKGVTSAMHSILEAVHHDFQKTLESRHATELLHHAIEACQQAKSLDPLLITNGDLDGTLANHRANMAAPVSHARFFLGQLIKTLST